MTGGRRPVLASAWATVRRERPTRDSAEADGNLVARRAASSPIRSTNAVMPTTPSPSTSPSIRRPGDGSARRAMPIGNIGDAATAMPVATMTPPAAMTSTRNPTVATRSRRVRPIAARVA